MTRCCYVDPVSRARCPKVATRDGKCDEHRAKACPPLPSYMQPRRSTPPPPALPVSYIQPRRPAPVAARPAPVAQPRRPAPVAARKPTAPAPPKLSTEHWVPFNPGPAPAKALYAPRPVTEIARFRSGAKVPIEWKHSEVMATLLQTPFTILDREQFDRARRLYKEGASGWVLEILESLGLLHMPVDMPGGCAGCYFQEAPLFWILDSLAVDAGNTRAAFAPTDVDLIIHVDGDTVEDASSSEILPEEEENLVRYFDQLAASPSLQVMVIRLGLTFVELHDGHATTLTLRKAGPGTYKIVYHDPNGAWAVNPIAAGQIKKTLALRRGGANKFEIEDPKCAVGAQSMQGESLTAHELGGYCTVWSAIDTIATIATDGASSDEITRDITAYIKPDSRGIHKFIQVVSRNVPRLIQTLIPDFPPEMCEKLECCSRMSYCFPPTPLGIRMYTAKKQSFVLGEDCVKSHPIASRASDPAFDTEAISWFGLPGNQLLGVWPDLPSREEFDRYVSFFKQPESFFCLPELKDSWFCPQSVTFGLNSSDAGFLVVEGVEPFSRQRTSESTLALFAQRLALLGQRMGICFLGLLTPENIFLTTTTKRPVILDVYMLPDKKQASSEEAKTRYLAALHLVFAGHID